MLLFILLIYMACYVRNMITRWQQEQDTVSSIEKPGEEMKIQLDTVKEALGDFKVQR